MGINARLNNAAAATVASPSAPTAYTAEASGAVAVVGNAADDLDTAQAALKVLRDEMAVLTTAVQALVVDVAEIRTQFND